MSIRTKWNYEKILAKCIEIHGDKYDYSGFTFYENLWQKINVFCKIHNKPFETFLSNHIKKILFYLLL